MYYAISSEQIDAAWNPNTYNHALAELGIKRCEGCGGGGRLFGPGYDRDNPRTYKECLDCEGRGWTVVVKNG